MGEIATGLRPLFETAGINPAGSIVVRTSIEIKKQKNSANKPFYVLYRKHGKRTRKGQHYTQVTL